MHGRQPDRLEQSALNAWQHDDTPHHRVLGDIVELELLCPTGEAGVPAGGLGDRHGICELAHRLLHPVREALHSVGDALVGPPVRPAHVPAAANRVDQPGGLAEPMEIASDTPETQLTLLQY